MIPLTPRLILLQATSVDRSDQKSIGIFIKMVLIIKSFDTSNISKYWKYIIQWLYHMETPIYP